MHTGHLKLLDAWRALPLERAKCLVHRQKEVIQRTGKIRIKLGMNPHISVGKKVSFFHIQKALKKGEITRFY